MTRTPDRHATEKAVAAVAAVIDRETPIQPDDPDWLTDVATEAVDEARKHLAGPDTNTQWNMGRVRADLDRFETDFPCDRACLDYAEEDCSRHGRKPADLWKRIDGLRTERDALAQTVASVNALVDKLAANGASPTVVHDLRHALERKPA